MAQTLIFSTLSGKVGYSDSANNWNGKVGKFSHSFRRLIYSISQTIRNP
jgi:hypothetical protein